MGVWAPPLSLGGFFHMLISYQHTCLTVSVPEMTFTLS